MLQGLLQEGRCQTDLSPLIVPPLMLEFSLIQPVGTQWKLTVPTRLYPWQVTRYSVMIEMSAYKSNWKSTVQGERKLKIKLICGMASDTIGKNY